MRWQIEYIIKKTILKSMCPKRYMLNCSTAFSTLLSTSPLILKYINHQTYKRSCLTLGSSGRGRGRCTQMPQSYMYNKEFERCKNFQLFSKIIFFFAYCIAHCKYAVPKIRKNIPRNETVWPLYQFLPSYICERFIYFHDRSANAVTQ